VITSPLTCLATTLPLLRLGCKLVWADIDPETLCPDPGDIEDLVTAKTKAVVLVNLGGIPARRPAVAVPVVADSCQALGVVNGTYTAFSFQAIKHLTTGDGGMLVLHTLADARQAKLRRWFGIDRERPLPEDWTAYKLRMMTSAPHSLGTKRHMNDLAAALGLAGLGHYDERHAHRLATFRRYQARLAGLTGIHVLDGPGNTAWLCTVLVERRDDFARMLWEQGVETNLVQVRNDRYPLFRILVEERELPMLNVIEDRYLSLPLGWHIRLEDVDRICDLIEAGW
jgi:dTDP-4-amino-4,6-dideoxygalactose transaminase